MSDESDEIDTYVTYDGMAVLDVGGDGTGVYLHVEPDTGDACMHVRESTYRYRGERSRKHTRSATVDAPVAHMTRFLVQALHVMGVDLGPEVRPTVDEAAIRADERAKCVAEIRAKEAEVDAMRHAAWSTQARRALRNTAEGYADAARVIERDGKHRSTP